MENELILIPDVHGRTFWKNAVKDLQPNQKVIFFGDEHDPYPQEQIDTISSLENFKEILKFKEEHMDQVVLLWGNHSFHYLYPMLNGSRKDMGNYEILHNYYTKHKDWFQFMYVHEENGLTTILSHAGVHFQWLNDLRKYLGLSEVKTSEEFINAIKTFNEWNPENKYVWDVSMYRGGRSRIGSCLWADIREWFIEPYFKGWIQQDDYEIETTLNINEIPQYENIYQIVGHSQLSKDPLISDKIAFIDCRRAFKYKKNQILELDESIPEKISFYFR